MPWSDSPDYELLARPAHAIGAAIIVVLIMVGWAWVSADRHYSAAHAGHPVASSR